MMCPLWVPYTDPPSRGYVSHTFLSPGSSSSNQDWFMPGELNLLSRQDHMLAGTSICCHMKWLFLRLTSGFPLSGEIWKLSGEIDNLFPHSGKVGNLIPLKCLKSGKNDEKCTSFYNNLFFDKLLILCSPRYDKKHRFTVKVLIQLMLAKCRKVGKEWGKSGEFCKPKTVRTLLHVHAMIKFRLCHCLSFAIL